MPRLGSKAKYMKRKVIYFFSLQHQNAIINIKLLFFSHNNMFKYAILSTSPRASCLFVGQNTGTSVHARVRVSYVATFHICVCACLCICSCLYILNTSVSIVVHGHVWQCECVCGCLQVSVFLCPCR